MTNEIYTDRSRVLTSHTCPRKRFLEYELDTPEGPGGVVPTRLNMDLVVGSAFHRGIQSLLLAYHVEKPVSTTVDDAVKDALEGGADWPGFWPLVKSRGLVLSDKEDAYYVYHEQAALVEALIRGYEAFVLPRLVDRFLVVEVEREDVGNFPGTNGNVIKFGMRADALLLEKDSNDLYVLSLKTTKEWGKKQEDSNGHDMQGLTEAMVVEERLRGWAEILDLGGLSVDDGIYGEETVPRWFRERHASGALPQVFGIKMEFALKGRRGEYPSGSGVWTYSNPLIRPWKKSDDLGEPQYAFMYEFQDELGGNHRLGKGWRRVNIWEDIGVKAWIELLKDRSIQGFEPGRGLAQQFVLPQEYYRNEEDMKDVEDEVVGQEEFIREGVGVVRQAQEAGDERGLRKALGKYFRKQTRSCDWPTKCEYQPVCFGPREYTLNPLASGLYQIREANHPSEGDYE